MTFEERTKKFQEAMAEIEQAFGVTVIASVHMEMLGENVLTRPVLKLVPLKGWRPVEGDSEGNHDT